MKLTLTKILIIFIVLGCGMSAVHSEEISRWEKWPKVESAKAQIGGKCLSVYSDPKNPSHILVYPTCWIIRLDTKVVISPNKCNYKIKNETLYYDKSWRDDKGYVTGVVWGDPKMEISFFSFLFRKPRFKDGSVSIWNQDEWIHVTGLPKLK